MADARKARRDAEKAALDVFAGTMVGAAGAIGEARAAQQDAEETVATAARKAADIIAAAKVQAAAVTAAADAEVTAAADRYADAYTAARDAGWTPAQLKTMGYDKPAATRRPAGPGPTGSTDNRTDGSNAAPVSAVA